ncbi:hypothetical protein BJV78DRAFT_796685 [Lactifluus subvellereus]|nr:hypothetical protein BJV78DRAFT_796685 [Lactifluus subvellereus]
MGNASTPRRGCNLPTPSEKKVRIRACFVDCTMMAEGSWHIVVPTIVAMLPAEHRSRRRDGGWFAQSGKDGCVRRGGICDGLINILEIERGESCEICTMSWTDTATNVATAAENKPVYNFRVDAFSGMEKKRGGLTKIRFPSASASQRSTILLSSSSASLAHMVKRSPEPLLMSDSPFDV